MEPARILFTRFAGDGKEMFNDLYAVDPDGTNETRLTMNPGPDGAYWDYAAPRYNRDRTMIAFVSTKHNERQLYNIFFLDLTSGKTAQITQGDLNIRSVDWSPDDKQLVFSANDIEGRQQIHVVNLDGTGFTQLTEGPSEHLSPLWSPRGDLIVYVEFPDKTERSHIWVMDPAGGNRRKLTADDGAHANPCWSPDGTRLIYCCDLGKPHLRILNVATGAIASFPAPEKGTDASPIWSEQGIVFSSNWDWEGDDALASLYLMTEQGALRKRLTRSQAYDYCGDW